MKQLLSKEHYCYKIQTSLTKSNGYLPLLLTNPLYGLPPPPNFCKEILILPFYHFQISITAPPSTNKGVHTMAEAYLT